MHRFTLRLACVALLGAGPAFGQASTSADDIVNQLKPTASQLGGPSRGILPVAPMADAQAVAVAPRAAIHRASYKSHLAAAPAASQDLPSVKLWIDFVTGSAELSPQAEHQLVALGHALTNPALANSHFRIEGHTDTVGSADANKDLSVRRAQAVSAYLEQNFAIDASRLAPVGLGQEELLVPTPQQTPEPRNRRVRIVNLSG